MQTVRRRASVRRRLLTHRRARRMPAQLAGDALLQATRAAEDRTTRAERTAALAEREVGFLKAFNVRSPLTVWCLFPLWEADPSATTRRATRAKKLCRAQVT